jgi:3-phosphoshikimate 1-carboxyvinyltransferase
MVHGDPFGDVTVIGAGLRAAHIGGDLVARTLDELPLVAVCAGVAEGETRVTGAGELRAKESDRIASVVAMVTALGGTANELDEGFVVRGDGAYQGGTTDAMRDHRIAMAAAVAATRSEAPITVAGFEAVDVSWPGFRDALESVWSSR